MHSADHDTAFRTLWKGQAPAASPKAAGTMRVKLSLLQRQPLFPCSLVPSVGGTVGILFDKDVVLKLYLFISVFSTPLLDPGPHHQDIVSVPIPEHAPDSLSLFQACTILLLTPSPAQHGSCI